VARARLPLALLLAALVIPASAAGASAYTNVLRTYEQTGAVPACRFSTAQLESALKGIDTYGAQYFADFSNAIEAALAARAAGGCASHAAAGQAAAGAAGAPGGAAPGPTARFGPITAPTAAGIPAPIIVMGALAAALGLVLVLVGALSVGRREPGWAAAWRHSWSEASWHAAGTWEELLDWLKPER